MGELMADGKIIEVYEHTEHEISENRTLLFHLRSWWLFNHSDLISIVYPETAFGVFSALSGSLLTTNHTPQLLPILQRIPHVLLWAWLNLTINTSSNQRLPASIPEDAVNKPWRPLPANRLTIDEARRFLIFAICAALGASLFLGGTTETLVLIILTYIYNDLGAADEHYAVRNLMNALAFAAYGLGTTRVACGTGYDLDPRAFQWVSVIGSIVFSTLQLQDMYDQEGDALRNRSTVPLVLGDGVARWTIAVPVLFWSFFCPWFWGLNIHFFAPTVLIGGIIATRVVLVRSVKGDRLTFRFWCTWMIVIYFLPSLKYYEALFAF